MQNIFLRIIADSFIILIAFLLPWWLWGVIVLFAFYMYEQWFEGVIIGAIVVLISFGGGMGVAIVASLIFSFILISSEIVRSKLR